MPSWRILEQSNPGGTSGLIDGVVLYLCSDRAWLEPRLPLAEVTLGINGFAVANSKARRNTPTSTTNRPKKTRTLKKADCELDFFFIVGN
jgi:hypothetical protein